MALLVVTQLLTLAQDPENRPFIVRDQGCLPGLVSFMENEDPQVVGVTLQVLHYLSLYPGNKEIMAKEPGLISGIRKHMSPGVSSTASMETAIATFTNLGQYVNRAPSPFSSPSSQTDNTVTPQVNISSSTSVSSTPMKPAATQGFPSDSYRTPLRERNEFHEPELGFGNTTGLSMFSEKVSSRLNAAKTYNFYIKGLNSESTKQRVEACLLGTKGIISFLIELHSHKAVVRTINSPEIILAALKEAGFSASNKESEYDNNASYIDKENSSPGYLNEAQVPTKKTWGWGSIVSFGTQSKDDGKCNQVGSQSWGWGNVAKAIWG